MTDLHEKNCIPCHGGVPPFDISEIHKYLKKIDGWDVKKKEKPLTNIQTVLNFVATLLVCAFFLAVVIYSLPL